MPRVGRPRQFDKAAAVRQAMALFWAHGYEATSLADLRAAMGGISSASFYAAFGSKESLFRAVVEEYRDTHGRVTASLHDPSLPPRRAIERALQASAAMQTDPAHPAGCLVVAATATCAAGNRHLTDLLAAERAGNRRGLRACVARAMAAGELPPETDPDALAAVFDAVLVGLSTQARDGVPAATLDAAVTRLMGLWDATADGRPAAGGDAADPPRVASGQMRWQPPAVPSTPARPRRRPPAAGTP